MFIRIKEKNDKIFVSKEEKDAQRVEHFKERLNLLNPAVTYDFSTFSPSPPPPLPPSWIKS